MKCKNCIYAKKQQKSNDIYSYYKVCVYYEKNLIVPNLLLKTYVLKSGKIVIAELIFDKNNKCKKGVKK